ncbi:MAG: hypothetical protein K6F05_00815 [Succinivibrio sp.]|nr:hypothetical protein [Succinivibrio sp.]
MHSKIKLAIAAAACFLLTACRSSTPSCNDSGVLDLVKQIAHDNYKGAYERASSPQGIFMLGQVLIYMKAGLQGNQIAPLGLLGINEAEAQEILPLYEHLLEVGKAGSNKAGMIEEVVAAQNFDVNTIRTLSKNEETKACKCAAKLDWNTPMGTTISQEIEYEAQYTEDSKAKLYVTVSALKKIFQGF